jgi:hypothetical protein
MARGGNILWRTTSRTSRRLDVAPDVGVAVVGEAKLQSRGRRYCGVGHRRPCLKKGTRLGPAALFTTVIPNSHPASDFRPREPPNAASKGIESDQTVVRGPAVDSAVSHAVAKRLACKPFNFTWLEAVDLVAWLHRPPHTPESTLWCKVLSQRETSLGVADPMSEI